MSYRIAVRELAEFTAKQGDLDLRFSPAPSAEEGMAGHAAVVAKRGADYQSEVSLSGSFGPLLVRGRADGYDPARKRIEEIKTYRGELARIPDNHRHLHWAQAKIYGWLMCEKLGLEEIEVALVYYRIDERRNERGSKNSDKPRETLLVETHAAQELKSFFEQLCTRFLGWAEQEMAHRAARDEALAALRFPHADFRTGQRNLAHHVYHAARSARCLMAQAPTGIGKTVGTLFPLLKAAPGEAFDKVFFLTAKTSGRALALGALSQIGSAGEHANGKTEEKENNAGNATSNGNGITGVTAKSRTPLRVVELVAREKACEHPDKACHGESCPLAKGFYDRLPQARSAAVAAPVLDKPALREIAREHAVCPYYLSQDLVRWADVVIGDYNYYFDASALLHSLTAANQWRVAMLVDEAHNLLERARGMYSAELDQRSLLALRRSAPAVLKKDLDRLQRSWNTLADMGTEDTEQPYRIIPDPPASFARALLQAVSAIGAFYAEEPAHADAALQRFYLDALHFTRLLESFGEHSLFDITLNRASPGIRPGNAATTTAGIRNLIPAPFLATRFAAARSCTLFSATLSPWHFYCDTLGLPEDTAWVDVESPFDSSQLDVRIASGISTRYHDRARSLAAIVDIIGSTHAERPGNYLAFFSSFDYLEQASTEFRARFPDVSVWEQARRMDEAAREEFLARFAEGGSGIGFAVLGGAFSEGIDLEGDRLIGAFVATLGLPQVNPFNEEVKARMEARFGAGYDYTYLFPGLRKVVQAAGRVIRTPQDRGIVVLMDQRYAQPQIRRLLPPWWQCRSE